MAALEYQGYSPEEAQRQATLAEFNAWLKQDRG